MLIFEISKSFPKEEMYSLTDQMRRSSRSTNICFVEAYRKRKYKAHFISKLSDSNMENSETKCWLKFALSCKYISIEIYNDLSAKSDEVGRLLSNMINNPEKYGV